MLADPGIALSQVELRDARQRVELQRALEELDRVGVLAAEQLLPRVPGDGLRMVGIERDRALEGLLGRGEIGGRGRYVPTGAGQEAERGVDIGVVRVERERLVEQGLRLRNHHVGLERAEIGVQDDQGVAQARVGLGELRVERDRLLEELPGPLQVLELALVEVLPAGEIEVVRLQVLRRNLRDALLLVRRQGRLELVRDRRRDLGLDRKEIVGAQPAVVGVRPEVLVGRRRR